MMFKARARTFHGDALADLRACADEFLGRTGSDRTSLGLHLASPSGREMIVAVARRFYASALPALFAERFGRPPALNLGITTVRLQAPDAQRTRVGWHLDLNFVGDTAPFLVAWVPLEDVGERCPGLDVCVPGSGLDLNPLLKAWAARTARNEPLVFSDQDMERLLGAGRYRLQSLKLSAGDAAVFDQLVLHRTQVLPDAPEPRRSFEFRMADLDTMPLYWGPANGLFCRRDETSPNGIEFLAKRRDRPPEPLTAIELDALSSYFRDPAPDVQPT